MDKIDRLLDAMEHSDKYSPLEIETMLRDSEVKEVFDLLDKTKSSLQPVTTPDIDAEWKKFEEKFRHSVSLNHNWLAGLFLRNAAASIATGIASFTAVAAIVGVGIHYYNIHRTSVNQKVETVTESVIIATQPDSIKSVECIQANTAGIVVFDDETLETIMSKIATHYGYQVVFDENASKSLRLYFRWNQAIAVEEVIERLNNFEQIKLTVKDKTIKVD